jgi:hypothetical protein
MTVPRREHPDFADDQLGDVWRGLVEEEVMPADDLELPDPSGWPAPPVDKGKPDPTRGVADP